jgi:hypothetical protein
MSTPRRIEYSGPEGWTVWADEDGVHVRTRHGDCLEASDLDRLIALVAEVRDQFASGTIPAPRPPGREERRQMYEDYRDESDAKRASRAVYKALAPTTDTPF